ncbi:DUF1501 domain-containing protein [Flagellimonas aequoris]|uniref:DUF1501 domain-containing protein n=1 Tax=Flagellimonas aequoris TaxID=2306997 RepID=A0A418N959_9FLAO|nr:DUF1501 domain-containing protein [Allomuricauda aequoris]RIV71542.1 DUF1501 domain-containing protein [Allomuricauda aequoris]TXK03107.1 DUF1501 domain-containing protein [Allomuricauda aequoris]
MEKEEYIIKGLGRRDFLGKMGMGLGSVALWSLLNPVDALAKTGLKGGSGGVLQMPHFVPKAKRVIYLFQSGGPAQQDLFDYKPLLRELNGQELPSSVRQGQRLTGMSAFQNSLPLAGSHFNFKQYGKNGMWVSDLLPHTAKIVDELCFIRSMYTEAINHDPAITFFQTGSQQPGRPSIGSWLSYGLGSDNENLPAFSVLLSRSHPFGQPLYSRLWGNGFLPSQHQGVQFRSGKDPVLYLNNPHGITKQARRNALDTLEKLHTLNEDHLGAQELNSKISQYEMAYRMQTSVPEAMSITKEPDYILDMYGPEARIPGTYAYNCVLARRLVERDVKFVQLYHQGWDQHGNLPTDIQRQCKSTDQPSAALILDLKQRGLLEDTLVIWGGEFGRTSYSQGRLTKENYGRDHHPRCFTMWMAGAGVKPGYIHGQTDDFGYNITENPVHVHDFQATLMYLLGIDHERLTYKFQGRRFRLTDVHGSIVNDILS